MRSTDFLHVDRSVTQTQACFPRNYALAGLAEKVLRLSANAVLDSEGTLKAADIFADIIILTDHSWFADVGVDRAAAETAVGIVLDFLAKEGPPDKVKILLAKLPGAEALMQKAASEGGGGMGGVMGAGMRMMGAGLSMEQVQALTRQFIAYAREKVGEDAVGEVVGAIPGLSQFV